MSRRTDASSAGGVGGVLFATGTYIGDGNLTQVIVGVGFRPRFVIIYDQDSLTDTPAFKSDQDGASAFVWYQGWATFSYVIGAIISLDADGFTVGDGTGSPLANTLNILGREYTYVCYG